MADYSGAAGGAISGASIGSTFGPIGTGVGAVAGGLLGLFGSKKKKKKPKKVGSLDPQQQALYNDYVKSLTGKDGPMSDMYQFNPEAANEVFNQNVARPAYRQFNENIVPKITGQYRGGNIMNSSYSGEALSRAGRDVQEGLDAKRAETLYNGQQATFDRRQNGINNVLNMQTFAYQKPQAQTPGVIDQVLNTVGPAAGEWFADYLKTKR